MAQIDNQPLSISRYKKQKEESMSEERSKPRRSLPPIRPVAEIEEMRRWFEEDIAQPVRRAIWERIPEEEKGWASPIDVFQKGDNFVVKVELPGIKFEDIDVSISENMLKIKAEKKPEIDVKNEDYERGEIVYGVFNRSVKLPAGIDEKSIEAIYGDGVLQINLKRTVPEKPNKVTVKIKNSSAWSNPPLNMKGLS